MKTEISKQLLSEVLGEEVKSIYNPKRDTNDKYDPLYNNLAYRNRHNVMDKINLDTLTRLCKEWALEQDILIYSVIYKDSAMAELDGIGEQYIPPGEKFKVDTELEAVIKACEWIIKEMK